MSQLPADQVGNEAVREWKRRQDAHSNRHSADPDSHHAHRAHLTSRKKRSPVTRTLPNSSSGGESNQQGVAPSSTTKKQDPAILVAESSSPLEIAETQQTQPGSSQDAAFSLHIPQPDINRDDYESLHGSQLERIGRLSTPSHTQEEDIEAVQSSTTKSQPGVNGHTPKNPSPLRKNVSSDELARSRTTRLRRRVLDPARVDHSPTVSHNPDSSPHLPTGNEGRVISNTPPPYPQPLTRHLTSSSPSQHRDTILSSPIHFQPQLSDRPVFSSAGSTASTSKPNDQNYLVEDSESPPESKSIYHSAEGSPADDLNFEPIQDSIEVDASPEPDEMDVSAEPLVKESDHTISEAMIPPSTNTLPTMYEASSGGSALPIQNSIEEEEPSSNGEHFSSDSKLSSSQQSVENERDIPQHAGLADPSLPILGPNEYALALPCEGKVQSTYHDIMNAKEKSIQKFLSRQHSIGSGNTSPNRAHERNEMNEMMQRLHDTVTHMDLGLGGFGTQYSIDSQENAAYANYAGSKFSFLGHLVDMLKPVGISIVIVSREGIIQDLLEKYLKMKHVTVNRQERIARSKSPAPDRIDTDFKVELVTSWSTHEVTLWTTPSLMIAFDSSFDSQDPQVARIRSFYDRLPRLMPVVHLLVTNSSEHVDRCLPKNIPSPIRLKALVRYTYRALPNLGGKPVYIERESDLPDGRPMDLSDLQRGLRKSPDRKISMLAGMVGSAVLAANFEQAWTLGQVPVLELTEMKEKPVPKSSRAPTRTETPRDIGTRSRTPVSRADTPSGRKRMLDIDGVFPALTKRQRLTPLRDSHEPNATPSDQSSQLAQLQDLLRKVQGDLAAEREARETAEKERNHVKDELCQWKDDHAGLLRRFEKLKAKCHELGREKDQFAATIENNKKRNERIAEDNSSLKQKNVELQKELTTVREEIKAGGGDASLLETAREEARTALARSTVLDKSLENMRKDFEFTRSQYQNASNKAAEFAAQVSDLEKQNADLAKQASDEKRRLKTLTYEAAINRHLEQIKNLELQGKSRDLLLRKLEDENRSLRRNRGVQTRGSSVQPPGSPGLDGVGMHVVSGRGTRSRQGSPAPGLFVGSHTRQAADRGSLLRNER